MLAFGKATVEKIKEKCLKRAIDLIESEAAGEEVGLSSILFSRGNVERI